MDESDEPRFGYEMASRATAYRCWRAHGDVGLRDTRTPPGWKPLCAPLVSGLPRESYSSLARSVRKILEVWPLSAQHGPVTVSTRSNLWAWLDLNSGLILSRKCREARCRAAAWSGRLDRFQGDLVAEPLELADELPLVVFDRVALLEVVVA